jgi:hypothetical protein
MTWWNGHEVVTVAAIHDEDDEYTPKDSAFKYMYLDLAQAYPVLDQTMECPVDNCEHQNYFGQVIIHLNDEHEWLRDEIATWVDTVVHWTETSDGREK